VWTLTFFCPRGEWGEANAVQEQWSTRSAKRNKSTRGAEIHLTALQVGVTIAQTRIHTKKIVGFRLPGRRGSASVVVLGLRVLGERVNELYSEKAKIAGRLLAQHATGNRRRFVRHQTRR
jgi:hypothetical protein